MNKIILIVFLILGITVNVFGATREKILRTGLVDTFAELDAIVADKALVNLADGGTFTGNIIANGNLSIGNAATTAGVLTLLEDTDAGSNFASFQVPALAANTIYTLPNAVGAAGNVLTDAAGNGILSWVEGGAGDITSVGNVASGAAFDGTQGTILTFYDVGGNMTLTYNGTTLTASKYITANVTGALTGNADTVTNGVYTTDAGTVFLAPAGDGASLTNVIHTEVDPTVDTAAEILTILDDTALDFGTGVLTATGFAGPLTGNADTVTNATLTTALTVNTGAVTLVGNAGASALTLGAGASSFSGTSSGTNTGGNTGDNTVCTSGTATTAATLATERAIYGNNFNGSAALTQVIASTYGGTGNGFTKFTGPTTAERVFTLPDATSTLLYSGGALGTPSGGTLTNCTGLPYTGLANGTDGNLITWAADATIAVVATGDAGQVLTSGGVGVAPTFQAAAAETLAATLAAGADANDVNITSGADIALDSLSSDGATIVIGLGDENTYTQTGGTTHAFTLGSSAGDDFTIDGTGFVYEGDTKSVGIGGPDIPKGSLNVFRSASDVNPVLLVEHVSNLTSSSYRDGLIVGEEGWDIGDMVLSLWTDGTNDVAYIEAARLSSYYIVPLVLQANGGNVGIGVTDPDQKLEVAGRIKMTTWTADGDTAAYRDTATDSIALVASDRRLKKNITPLTSALDIVKQLETYKYNDLDEEDTKKKRLGLMGGEVLEIIPELTFEIIRTTVDEVTGENIEKIYYGVHYDKLPVLLLGAIKEQQAEIEILKLRIDKLEKKNAN